MVGATLAPNLSSTSASSASNTTPVGFYNNTSLNNNNSSNNNNNNFDLFSLSSFSSSPSSPSSSAALSAFDPFSPVSSSRRPIAAASNSTAASTPSNGNFGSGPTSTSPPHLFLPSLAHSQAAYNNPFSMSDLTKQSADMATAMSISPFAPISSPFSSSNTSSTMPASISSAPVSSLLAPSSSSTSTTTTTTTTAASPPSTNIAAATGQSTASLASVQRTSITTSPTVNISTSSKAASLSALSNQTSASLISSFDHLDLSDADVAPAIVLRKLPRNTSPDSLRSMLLFAKDLIDVDFLPVEHSDDPGFVSAMARFHTLASAHEARDRLNGKANTANDANMIVDVFPHGFPGSGSFGSSRPTPDNSSMLRRGSSTSMLTSLATSASTAISNGPAPLRMPSRFNETFQSLERSSPQNASSLSSITNPLAPPHASHLQSLSQLPVSSSAINSINNNNGNGNSTNNINGAAAITSSTAAAATTTTATAAINSSNSNNVNTAGGAVSSHSAKKSESHNFPPPPTSSDIPLHHISSIFSQPPGLGIGSMSSNLNNASGMNMNGNGLSNGMSNYISSKQIIDIEDEDTGRLLKDPIGYAIRGESSGLNGIMSSMPSSSSSSSSAMGLSGVTSPTSAATPSGGHVRRQTNPGQLNQMSRFPPPPSLSLGSMNVGLMNDNSKGISMQPYSTTHGSSIQTSGASLTSALLSPISTPVSGGGPGGGFPYPQQYQRHTMPPVNPADQNPPCNTLYVGNLPIDTSEDELKAMFSKQRGYKRLCFRTKQNGPMCFVEFENVSFATKALNELYGHPLHNSVKGGIRLSFSKNPLGVRSTPNSNSNNNNNANMNQPASLSSTGGGLNGMSSMHGYSSVTGPPPGLGMPPGLSGPSILGTPATSSGPGLGFLGHNPYNYGMASSVRSQPVSGAGVNGTSRFQGTTSDYSAYMMGR